MPKEGPYTRVTWRGVTLNARTRDALRWAERRWQRNNPGLSITPVQGSYNKGGVSASGGTHDGGGAVDIRTRNLTTAQRIDLVKALKDAGFGAWYRAPSSSWGPHVHAIAIEDKEMSPSAAAQVRAFDAGRDGLTGNRPDDTYRPKPKVRFSYAQGKPTTR